MFVCAESSSASAQETAAKLSFLEEENVRLQKRLEDTEAGADAAAADAAKQTQQQLADMDVQLNAVKGEVAKLERQVTTLTKRNAFLEEANARSTRGLRAGRAVVAVSKRRQAQMRQLQKQKKGAGLYSAMRGMLRKTNSPLLNNASRKEPSMGAVVLDAMKHHQEQREGGGRRAQTCPDSSADSGFETPDEDNAI